MTVKFEEMTGDEDDDDESDKHLEARDRRYSCLKWGISKIHQGYPTPTHIDQAYISKIHQASNSHQAYIM